MSLTINGSTVGANSVNGTTISVGGSPLACSPASTADTAAMAAVPGATSMTTTTEIVGSTSFQVTKITSSNGTTQTTRVPMGIVSTANYVAPPVDPALAADLAAMDAAPGSTTTTLEIVGSTGYQVTRLNKGSGIVQITRVPVVCAGKTGPVAPTPALPASSTATGTTQTAKGQKELIPPPYKNFIELMENPQPLFQFVTQNPFRDIVYRFDCRIESEGLPIDDPVVVFSGSAAVKFVSQKMAEAKKRLEDKPQLYRQTKTKKVDNREHNAEIREAYTAVAKLFRTLTKENIHDYICLDPATLLTARYMHPFGANPAAFNMIKEYKDLCSLIRSDDTEESDLHIWDRYVEDRLQQLKQNFEAYYGGKWTEYINLPDITSIDHLRAHCGEKTGYEILKEARLIRSLGFRENPELTFTPGDVDLFLLNQKKTKRHPINGMDVVHSTEKTAGELILNFDLPCCRAAYTEERVFYVSAQCLFAILTGLYFVPHYLQDKHLFLGVLTEIRHQAKVTPQKAGRDLYLYNRLTERMLKYRKRGFLALPMETDYVLPWLTHRFDYAEAKKQ